MENKEITEDEKKARRLAAEEFLRDNYSEKYFQNASPSDCAGLNYGQAVEAFERGATWQERQYRDIMTGGLSDWLLSVAVGNLNVKELQALRSYIDAKMPEQSPPVWNDQDMEYAFKQVPYIADGISRFSSGFVQWLRDYRETKFHSRDVVSSGGLQWKRINPAILPMHRGIILTIDGSIKEGPVNKIYQLAPEICTHYILISDLINLPKQK